MKEIIELINKIWFKQTQENHELSYRFTDGVIHTSIGCSHKFKNVKILNFYILDTENFKIIKYKSFKGTYKEIYAELEKINLESI